MAAFFMHSIWDCEHSFFPVLLFLLSVASPPRPLAGFTTVARVTPAIRLLSGSHWAVDYGRAF
ncbi:MAG: hypothetical protein JWR61_864 [Ferruginibacter sp.]|nr:hypothetical protein [Ferruginibacter sp.]